ncbi:hypothetical protein EX30DRAFT_398337 [Ascodesmis nigricans]|uniref:Uncharacterized protein n=1 Tax=Ascodesmis nigricans TaxID=341454 RepID=A0A4S2MRK3_9PEZI|nr:hypothetical protein EX30DRAFT_398337 [Ascodesmis nigricans]
MTISPTLHRIPITSPTSSSTIDSFLLLHCTPMDPSEPLNLTLRATEGTTPFFAKIRRSKLATYRHRNYGGTELELENVFMRVLLRQKVEGGGVGLHGVELGASVSDEAAFITIRQRIGGILKGIADIKIPAKMDEEMDPFEWAAGSCLELDTALADLKSANEQVAAQQAEVEKMKSLFEDLEALKKEHEETMLIKFRDLLNSKKEKIRELQKVLEEAQSNTTQVSVDRSKTEESPSPEPAPRRKAGTTKKSTPAATTRATRGAATTRKRKPAAPPPEETDSEDEFAANSPPPPRRGATRGRGARGAPGGATTTTRTTRTKSPEPSPVVKQEEADDDDRTASETDDLADDAQVSDAGQRESEDEIPPPRKPAAFFQGRKPAKEEGADEKKAEPEPMEWDPSTMTAGAGGWDAGNETEDDEL